MTECRRPRSVSYAPGDHEVACAAIQKIVAPIPNRAAKFGNLTSTITRKLTTPPLLPLLPSDRESPTCSFRSVERISPGPCKFSLRSLDEQYTALVESLEILQLYCPDALKLPSLRKLRAKIKKKQSIFLAHQLRKKSSPLAGHKVSKAHFLKVLSDSSSESSPRDFEEDERLGEHNILSLLDVPPKLQRYLKILQDEFPANYPKFEKRSRALSLV